MRRTLQIFRRPVLKRTLSMLFVITLMSQMLAPLEAYALTSGPTQPEFTSFESVATTQMVNQFTGDFTYNLPLLEIPGPDGAGYPVSLSYHSGTSPEEEASWVGYGWTLNPGAVTRSKQGFPDDHKGEEVTYYNKVPKNWTASVSSGLYGLELFSTDFVSLSVSLSLRYNNYTGFGYTAGPRLSAAGGLVSLGYSWSDGDGSFNYSINPAAALNKENLTLKKEIPDNVTVLTASDGKGGKRAVKDRAKDYRNYYSSRTGMGKSTALGAAGGMASQYGNYGFATDIRPSQVTHYTGKSFNATVTLVPSPAPVDAGPSLGLSGSFSWQQNDALAPLGTYGYLYSNDAAPEDMMDYAVEKDQPFSRRDHYMGIPYSTADNFIVNGEGVGGGFRLYNRGVGHFRPNAVESKTQIFQVGGDINIGLEIGTGADVGVGEQVLSTEGWDDGGFGYASTGDEPYYFRFNGDRGGHISYGDDKARQAAYSGTSITGISGVATTQNSGARSGRSSFVDYHTNGEMNQTVTCTNPSICACTTCTYRPKSYTLDDEYFGGTGGLVRRDNIADGIGELAIVNESGMTHVFGLPVFSRRETMLSYGLDGVSPSDITDLYQVTAARTPETAAMVVGETSEAPYASQYLLTAILSPQYIDRTMNGLTSDDFGAWTKFNYTRVHGSQDKKDASGWYKWRSPYNRLLYRKGEIHNPDDDMGFMSCGEKEVYYLSSIETRTHIATFVLSDRSDGKDAHASEATASGSPTAMGSNGLKKLDKIVLYSKDPATGATAEIVKVVNFDYTYEVWPNTPNSSATGEGRLTLKRVWFDYSDKVNALISPYEFYYKYPTSSVTSGAALADYPTRYDALEDYGSGLDEDPDYDPLMLDAWGCYSPDGPNQFGAMRTWTDQTPTSTYDPAAWQLKSITLPSGGQIHIQYEQDLYQHVQDRPAMAMVSMDPALSGDTGPGYEPPFGSGIVNTYFLNTADVGISPGSPEESEMANMIRKYYLVDGHKLYFKFLYALIGGSPALDKCNSEYIQGYVNVVAVDVVSGSGIRITLGNGTADNSIPRQVCREYVNTQAGGNLEPAGNCNAVTNGVDYSESALDVLYSLVSKLGLTLAGDAISCLEVDFTNSYFRVPLPIPKRGGGVRVKRIMMYDEGLEADEQDKVLYGTEYLYQMTDGKCSGVASNEPGGQRSENPLMEPLDRQHQSLLSKIIAGDDLKELEGPIGETVLPGASVGYRSVIAKSIHEGETSPGFTVSRFNTQYEYPYDRQYFTGDNDAAHHATGIDESRFPLFLPGVIVNLNIDNRRATQGYRFIQYDIAGSPESVISYGGRVQDLGDPSKLYVSSSEHYEYFKPNEGIPILEGYEDINTSLFYPGREMEVVTESRHVADVATDASLEFDIGVGVLLIPIPFGSMMGSLNYSESRLRTHVTTKIVRYPAIQKRSFNQQDGISHMTEYLAFNAADGKPLITRTTDGYHGMDLRFSTAHDGHYTSHTIPGTLEYPELGQKAQNARKVVGSFISGGSYLSINKVNTGGEWRLFFSGSSTAITEAAMANLTPGDLIQVGTNDYWTVTALSGSHVTIQPSGFLPHIASTSSGLDVLVLRSGYKNQLGVSIESYTTYGAESGITVIPIDAGVLSARAALVTALNAAFTSLPTGIYQTATSCSETFLHSLSPEPGVQMTGATGGVYLKLVDWAASGEEEVCEMWIPMPGYAGSGSLPGDFVLDAATGEIVWEMATTGYQTELPCLKFCKTYSEQRVMENVIRAQATYLSDIWSYPYTYQGESPALANDHEAGRRGQWRAHSSYAYREMVKEAAKDDSPDDDLNYLSAGTFDFVLYNFQHPGSNDPLHWLKGSTMQQYSPNGMAVQEQDVLKIFSTAKFGYYQSLPYLVAKNSAHEECYFESYENVYTGGVMEEDVTAPTISTANAHSGFASAEVTYSGTLVLKDLTLNGHLLSEGIQIKMWVKDPTYGTSALQGILNGAFTVPLSFTWVARTGEWNLYEARVTSLDLGAFTAGQVVTPMIQSNLGGSYTIYVDDVRMQPYDAEMACYVYDRNTFRLLTTFDDQHFGKYNRYDGEGRLTRVQIETERGMKTVQEGQYHTPQQQR